MKWKGKYCFEQGGTADTLLCVQSGSLFSQQDKRVMKGEKVFLELDCQELMYSPILFVCRKESQNKPN